MKERILQLITRMAYTSTRFADEIGVQRSGISHILSGRNQPSYDLIVKILNRFSDINTEWFVLGKGPMLKSSEKGANLPPEAKNKAYPVPNEPDLFTRSIPGEEKLKQMHVDKNKVTNVTIVDRIVVLNSDGTFEVYHQAKRE